MWRSVLPGPENQKEFAWLRGRKNFFYVACMYACMYMFVKRSLARKQKEIRFREIIMIIMLLICMYVYVYVCEQESCHTTKRNSRQRKNNNIYVAHMYVHVCTCTVCEQGSCQKTKRNSLKEKNKYIYLAHMYVCVCMWTRRKYLHHVLMQWSWHTCVYTYIHTRPISWSTKKFAHGKK